MKKGQMSPILLVIAFIAVVMLHQGGYLMDIYQTVEPKPLTGWVDAGSVGTTGRIVVCCPQAQAGADQLDYCDYNYVCSDPSFACSATGRLDPGQCIKRCYTDTSQEVEECRALGYEIMGRQNSGRQFALRQYTLHYCGNGQCESFEDCTCQDCAACVTTTTQPTVIRFDDYTLIILGIIALLVGLYIIIMWGGKK